MTWPADLLPLVEQHGERRLWSVGIEALGYPPTWADYRGEQLKVAVALD